MAITLVAYVLVNLVQIALVDVSVSELLLYLVVDPLLLMGGLWLVMTLFGRKERCRRPLSAVLGCSALMGLVVFVPMVLLVGPRMAGNPPAAVQLLALGLVIAFILVVGRIIQLATDSNLLTGSAIATYLCRHTPRVGRECFAQRAPEHAPSHPRHLRHVHGRHRGARARGRPPGHRLATATSIRR